MADSNRFHNYAQEIRDKLAAGSIVSGSNVVLECTTVSELLVGE